MKLKKVLSWTLALALSFSLAAPALAADTSFTDVKPGAWYYDYVTQCVSRGLMSGMGDNRFGPDETMTVGQFLRVAVSAVYPDQVKAAGSAPWWDPYYAVALEKELINSNQYARTAEAMNQPITRQEMALIAIRVTDANGETRKAATPSLIPDYNSLGQDYRVSVLNAYGKGILAGVDDKGTFDPTGVLTRGAASVVILHMVDPSTRISLPTKDATIDPVTGVQTFYEGQPHQKPKAGDIVIKADGTRVVLEETILKFDNHFDTDRTVTILGLFQNVDYITGWGDCSIGSTSIGTGFGGGYFRKDTLSDTVLSDDQWDDVRDSNLGPRNKDRGSYAGEIRNIYWAWDPERFGGAWAWLGPNTWTGNN